jgi:hypothetical protein
MCGKADAKWHLQDSHSKLQLEERSVTIWYLVSISVPINNSCQNASNMTAGAIKR